MEDLKENVIEWLLNDKTATVTLTQGRFITKVKELASKYPEDVKITRTNTDGSIVACIPTSYISISNRSKNLTDEQRQAIKERLNRS